MEETEKTIKILKIATLSNDPKKILPRFLFPLSSYCWWLKICFHKKGRKPAKRMQIYDISNEKERGAEKYAGGKRKDRKDFPWSSTRRVTRNLQGWVSWKFYI